MTVPDQPPKEKTGRLDYTGPANLGSYHRFNFYRCVDCGTDYPYFTREQAVQYNKRFGEGIYCNGMNIISCPYCTPAGQKFTNPNCKPTEDVVIPVSPTPKPPAKARLLLGLGHVCFMVGGWLDRLGKAMVRLGAKLRQWG